jgi:DNA-binding PadR family transcriptional regulator
MSNELNPTSYVVLALVGRDGAAPHDIASMLRRSPLYWSAAPSRYYSEPKRLERLGYLSSRSEPGRTRPRTVYMLTERGLAALRGWLAEPARFPEIRNEAAVRLLAGDLVDDETIVASLRGLADQVDALERDLDESERIAEGIPHRARYLALSHRLPRKLLAAHREWIAEVEQELGGGSR